jgi:hypothetical protein
MDTGDLVQASRNTRQQARPREGRAAVSSTDALLWGARHALQPFGLSPRWRYLPYPWLETSSSSEIVSFNLAPLPSPHTPNNSSSDAFCNENVIRIWFMPLTAWLLVPPQSTPTSPPTWTVSSFLLSLCLLLKESSAHTLCRQHRPRIFACQPSSPT